MSDARPAPSWGRIALRTVLTAGIAAAIIWWSLRGTDWAAVRDGLDPSVLPALMGCVLVFAVSFGTCDVLAFGAAWRRHLDPQVPWRDVRTLVLGKQLLFATVPLLTKTVPPAYFWRRRGLPLGRVVGASELVSMAELLVVLTVVAITALTGQADLGPTSTWVVVGLWLAMVVGACWVRRPGARGDLGGLLRALRTAAPRELVTQLGLRALHLTVAVSCVGVLLHRWGADLDLGRLVVFGALFLISGTLPISLGGFGGPQGVAVALLVHSWGVLSAPQALGFSLCWSTAVLVTQLATGTVHLPRLLRLLRAQPTDRPISRS